VTVTDTTTNQYRSGSGNVGPEDLQSVTVTVDSISLINDANTRTARAESLRHFKNRPQQIY
jgi:hypothetical protein